MSASGGTGFEFVVTFGCMPDVTEQRSAQAKQLIADRRYAEAIRVCRRILLSQPDDPETRRLLAMALLAAARPSEARVETLALIRQQPEDSQAHRLLAETYLRSGRIEQARAAVQHALELDPNDEIALGLMAEIDVDYGGSTSATLERWFDPEAVATTQTDLPDEEPSRVESAPSRITATFREPEVGGGFEELPGEATHTTGLAPLPPARTEVTRQLEVEDLEEFQSRDGLEDPHENPMRDSDDATGEFTPRSLARSSGALITFASSRPEPTQNLSENLPSEEDFEEEPTRHRAHPSTSEASRDQPTTKAPQASPWEPSAQDPPTATPSPSSSQEATEAEASSHSSTASVRRLRLLDWRVLMIVGAIVSSAILVIVAWRWIQTAQTNGPFAQAVQVADATGTAATILNALELSKELDPERTAAVRARLLATLVLEHGRQEDVSRVREALSAVEADPTEETHIAKSYLALARGDRSEALDALRLVGRDDGTASPELARAQALVALAHGEHEVALASSRLAVEKRPGAPRDLALYARLLASQGAAAAALTALDRAGAETSSPWLTLGYLHALQALPKSSSRRSELSDVASALLTDASSSPRQQAWARLVIAQDQLEGDDLEGARQHAVEAWTEGPQADPDFLSTLLRALIDAGAVAEAGKAFDARAQVLPALDRLLIRAELALARQELEAADRALAMIDEPSPRAELLRGRLEAYRGKAAQALSHYQRAATDSDLASAAIFQQASLLRDLGKTREAIAVLEQAKGSSDGELEPRLDALLIHTLIDEGSLERARALSEKALAARPEDRGLFAAHIGTLLAQGLVDRAESIVQERLRSHSGASHLYVLAGEIALKRGQPEEARRAFEAALEHCKRCGDAWLGLAEAAALAGHGKKLEQALAGAEKAGAVADIRYRGLEGVALALKGAGRTAVARLEAIPESDRSAAMWAALGWAHVHAEELAQARAAFEKALSRDGEGVEGHFGLAWLDARLGHVGRAKESLEKAERLARRDGLEAGEEARLLVARARNRFALGNFSEAKALALEALSKDSRSSGAHLLIANVAIEQGEDPTSALREAGKGSRPSPEAWGRLAIQLGSGPEACALAEHYLEAAPGGFDAASVRRIADKCPKP